MDCVFTWDYNSLINELTQGMEHTKQLRTYLSSVASTSEATPDLLLQKILSSYEQSLLILQWTGSSVQSPPPAVAIESMVPGDGSPRSDDKKRSFKDHQELIHISKRRKSQFTEQVRVSTESGFEGSLDDGYSWRKYGQKDILGANFPRGYYRCTFRIIGNCWATKQVQRSDVDPTVFEITYRGYHTCQCHQVTNSILQATSPEKQANHHSLIGGGYSPYFVSAEGGFDSIEGPIDGGYSWRKYGQKDILGAKHPSKISQPTWTEQVRVPVERGLETPSDGYSWRKYGQRDILGAVHPRSYYRCKYWILQGCGATKQVQRPNEDPTVFEITYKDSHTCHEVTNSALQPKSPEKQANHQTQTGGGYSPSFVSPTTTESNYFSVSGGQINSFGIVHNSHHSESYLTDIGIIQNLYHSDSDRTHTFSANTSTTSSSIAGMDVQWAEFRQVKVG